MTTLNKLWTFQLHNHLLLKLYVSGKARVRVRVWVLWFYSGPDALDWVNTCTECCPGTDVNWASDVVIVQHLCDLGHTMTREGRELELDRRPGVFHCHAQQTTAQLTWRSITVSTHRPADSSINGEYTVSWTTSDDLITFTSTALHTIQIIIIITNSIQQLNRRQQCQHWAFVLICVSAVK